MAERINSWCAVCGKGYNLCMSCRDTKTLSPWKVYTDTSEHYKIFQVLLGLTNGVYTKEQAKAKLEKIDLSDLEDLREDKKVIIKELLNMKADKPAEAKAETKAQ